MLRERCEEDWKKKTRDRGGWKRLSDEAVKKLRAAPHPLTKGNEEERRTASSRSLYWLFLFIIGNLLRSFDCGSWYDVL